LLKYIQKNVSTIAPQKKIDYSEIITEEEILHILDKGCKSTRDKAFLYMLHETGVRIAEFLNIKIKHLHVEDDCIKIQVDGKTNKRQVHTFLSCAHCKRWLNVHPNPNPESYLWVSTSNSNRGELFSYNSAVKIVDKAIRKAKINKKKNLHWFRHSRATENAQELSNQMLCAEMGWSQGTKQLRNYVHVGAKQVEQALRKARGLTNKNELFTTVKCPQCDCTNHKASQYCNQFGHSLSRKSVRRKEEIYQIGLDIYAKIQANEKLRKDFEKYKKNKEKEN